MSPYNLSSHIPDTGEQNVQRDRDDEHVDPPEGISSCHCEQNWLSGQADAGALPPRCWEPHFQVL